MDKKELFNAGRLQEALERIAGEILAGVSADPDDFALVGLYRQGVPLAERLGAEIERRTGRSPLIGKLDISMYRDDVGLRSGLPLIRETVIPFDMQDMKVILVDDVLTTGRTIRAALDALTDYGRPALIRLAVLVDRGQPEFPIRADYTGFNVRIAPDHKVVVELAENDDCDAIWEKQS
ncbi:MAG: bifunctional pyr operon transcriptional regulator/uracil phosphoribosyltransferase PyrR [Victivallaceae bacterium]